MNLTILQLLYHTYIDDIRMLKEIKKTLKGNTELKQDKTTKYFLLKSDKIEYIRGNIELETLINNNYNVIATANTSTINDTYVYFTYNMLFTQVKNRLEILIKRDIKKKRLLRLEKMLNKKLNNKEYLKFFKLLKNVNKTFFYNQAEYNKKDDTFICYSLI